MAKRINQSPEIKFETQAQAIAFLKERREHLVIKIQRKKYILVDTFKNIEEARECIQRINVAQDSNKNLEKIRRPTEKSKYLIWVCPNL